tara:strand:- start:16483 stop:17373 length:891 start_codon:yes stop_codon:yes gene_type:complete
MRKLIKISDVSARDGLQSLKKILSLDQKIMLINDLTKCKFDEIEIGSLVNYKVIPTMKGSLELHNHYNKLNEYNNYFLLMGNEKSINIANSNGMKNISFFTSSSDTFNIKNINMNISESFSRISKMIKMIKDRKNVYVKGYLSCVGSCPFEGDININSIIDSVIKFKEIGVNEVCLADTIGDLKKEKLEKILNDISNNTNISSSDLSIHLHTDLSDDYWKENLKTALKYNINKYDTSILNLGGCPAIYKKKSCSEKLNGNLNIVDAFDFFTNEGYELNVDIEKVKQVEKNWKNILI